MRKFVVFMLLSTMFFTSCGEENIIVQDQEIRIEEIAEEEYTGEDISLMIPIPEDYYDTENHIVYLVAKALYGECRGVDSTTEKAAVAWIPFNRLDSGRFGDSMYEVLTAPNQFVGYSPDNPLDPELLDIARDVYDRWRREKSGEIDVGRVIPSDYYFFSGNGTVNHFRKEYLSKEYWDWSLESIYKD